MVSQLSDLYQEVILDHNKKPRNFQKLDDANHHADGFNPLCGDNVSVYILVNGDRVEKIAFEAISAASTTGLSLGITGDLTAFGKTVIIATMFLGRVGPLVLLGTLIFRVGKSRPYDYPHESVVIG